MSSKIKIGFGNFVKVARQAGAETPSQLQQKTGISYSICHRLFNGSTSSIDCGVLERLCTGLNLTPNDVLIEKGRKAATNQ